MVHALEQQAPIWPPGTKHGYHMHTFGWLAGELIRRADPEHRTAGRFLAEEIAAPLGLSFWIGLPEGIEQRYVARLVPPDTRSRHAPAELAPMTMLLTARVLAARAAASTTTTCGTCAHCMRVRVAVVERHRRRPLARAPLRSGHRFGRRLARAARRHAGTRHGNTRVRQGRGAHERIVLRPRLHARPLLRRRQPAARRGARRSWRFARVR